MKRYLLIFLLLPALAQAGGADLSLDYCIEKAELNYPLVKKYALVEATGRLSLDDINRGWLPRIELYGQGTVQNAVPAFPDILRNMPAQAGADMRGLGHLQYKVGIELNQTVWDGGASRSRRAIERATTAQTQAALDVELYAVRAKVEEIYFGILLLQEQIGLTEESARMLEQNHRLLQAMGKNGTAMQADADAVEAQLLSIRQQLTEAQSAAEGYMQLLSIYIGENLAGRSLLKPEAQLPAENSSQRPELELFSRQLELNRLQNEATGTTLMPRVGFFAQAYYGYPGFDYFKSMRNRDMSVNLLAGVKVSWAIDAFYTRNNKRDRLAAAADMVRADRDMFLFGTQLESSRERSAIDGIRQMMKDDARIVELRSNVRQAAESKLEHGVIDTTTLLARITDENRARLTAAYHEIQLLQSIYQLKHTLNQ